MPPKPLANDEAFVKAINKHWKRYYCAPTVRWLAQELGYHTTCSIQMRLLALDVQGVIWYVDGKAIPFWVIRTINEAEAK